MLKFRVPSLQLITKRNQVNLEKLLILGSSLKCLNLNTFKKNYIKEILKNTKKCELLNLDGWEIAIHSVYLFTFQCVFKVFI